MSELRRWRSYTTFTELGGPKVTPAEVTVELTRLPLDGVLGFLGRLSLLAVRPDVKFFDPPFQGEYLNLAIVDDFPTRLPRAVEMYQPGRIPTTGERHLFIHQRNIAWLAHHAILNCQRDATTAVLMPSLQERCCRLLLIVNDFFAQRTVDATVSLAAGRAFALEVLRLQQFMDLTSNTREAVRALAREWLLLARFLPPHFEVELAFSKMAGVPLAEYFEVLMMLILHFSHTLPQAGNPWQSRSGFFKDLLTGRETAQRVLDQWVSQPEEYADSCVRFAQRHQLDEDALEHFDYVALQATPIIEARFDELMIPVLPYLYAKAADEPYFFLAGDNAFRTAYGRAYEDYAHSLLERIAAAASDGPWTVWRSPPGRAGEEYCDTVLVKGSTAIVFEHKGGRLHSAFIRGGEGERVLGPPKATLDEVGCGTDFSPQDLKANDKALLTRGLWQLGSSAAALVSWIEGMTGGPITAVWPVLTHHAKVRIDVMVRLAFLNRLLDAVMPFPDTRWHRPEWLQVADLEALAQSAVSGQLHLRSIFERKATEAPNESFEGFLRQTFSGFPLDAVLDDTALDLMQEATRRFWLGRTPPALPT